MWEDNNICHWCQKPVELFEQASIEHIVALADGGTHTPDNWAISHIECNTARGSLHNFLKIIRETEEKIQKLEREFQRWPNNKSLLVAIEKRLVLIEETKRKIVRYHSHNPEIKKMSLPRFPTLLENFEPETSNP